MKTENVVDLSNENLIRRAIARDPEAFGQLYKMHYKRIFGFIWHKVQKREDAEEIVQSVFLKTWRHIHRYRPEILSFAGWIDRIARNAVIDHWRAKGKAPFFEEINEDTCAAQDEISFHDRAMTVDRVHEALLRLKQEYQDVIRMRFVEDRSLCEVARIMQKGKITVLRIQRKAIVSLCGLLAA